MSLRLPQEEEEEEAGSLYSPSCREQAFSETHIQLCESLCVRTGAKRLVATSLAGVKGTDRGSIGAPALFVAQFSLVQELVKNSAFASCAGPLKSVGSVAVTGLEEEWYSWRQSEAKR